MVLKFAGCQPASSNGLCIHLLLHETDTGTWLDRPSDKTVLSYIALAGIAFYLYFLITQREFAYREWKNQMMTNLQVCQ